MASKSSINCCFEKSLCDNPLKTSILNDYSIMNYNKIKDRFSVNFSVCR